MLCHSHALIDEPAAATESLQLTGYVRGAALSVNRLVHVPGFGDFPIRKLEIIADPHRPRRTGAAGAADAAAAEAGSSMDTEGASEPEPGAVLATLLPDPAKQMDREYAAEGDDTMNEQT